MENKKLVNYMAAVCNAENALHACDESIEELKRQLNKSWPTIWLPCEPDISDIPIPQPKYSPMIKVLKFLKVPAVIFIGLLVGSTFQSMLACIIAAVLSVIMINLFVNSMIESAKKEARQKRDASYQAKLNDYHAELAACRKKQDVQEQLRSSFRKEIEAAIAENTSTRFRIRSALDTLYAQDVIYPRFRNLPAVNQLAEYLEMGLCSELEGTNGAYNQYLQDLRAERICGSVNELKQSMERSMNRLLHNQERIVSHLRATNESILNMQSSFSTGLDALHQEITNGNRAISESTNASLASFAALNGQVEQMRKTIHASAHNEYIALREADIRNYLLKNPNYL